MARRATSLGPKPSLFSFCFFFFLFLFFFFFFFFLCLFLLCFKLKNPVFPPKKGNFCLFICVSLSFSLALFGPPPLSPFSFFVSLFFSFFFLPSFHFCFCFLLFLFVFFASCLVQDFILLSFLFLLVVLFCFESSCLISCCLASCFLVVVVFCFCCFHILLFLKIGNLSKNMSEKFGYCKKAKNEKCTKKGHFDKSS